MVYTSPDVWRALAQLQQHQPPAATAAASRRASLYLETAASQGSSQKDGDDDTYGGTEDERRAFVDSLLQQPAAGAAGGGASGTLLAAPAWLLRGVQWSVGQPVEQARWASDALTTHTAADFAGLHDVCMHLQPSQALCTQALAPLSDSQQLDAAGWGGRLTAADLDAAALHARCATLLLPNDGQGLLGHSLRSVRCDGGAPCLTLRALMQAIRDFYNEPLPMEEAVAAMQCDGGLCAALRADFIAGRASPRCGLLLGRCGVAGLVRASRNNRCMVYELQLTA